MQLIVRKDYESITVQDLLDKADIGRSTFYAHYAGKDDLLRKGFEQLRTELTAACNDSGPAPLAFSSAMFAHAERYKDIYRALVGGRGNSIILGEIRRVLLESVEPQLKRTGKNDAPTELLARYVVDAFQSVLTWWLERRPDLSSEQIDRMFRQLVVPSLKSRQTG
ncbi:MAG: TetR/AcrR family transcriptional regulator [Sphingomicrobium sp.]